MKTTLDMLTETSVSIKTETDVIHRKAYVNSERGRAELLAEVGADMANEILKAWGDKPTVVEEVPEIVEDKGPQKPTLEQRIETLERVVEELGKNGKAE